MCDTLVQIPRFIAGMSRGGTTWMNRVFNEHPSLASFGETAFWGRCYIEPGSDGQYNQSQLERVVGRLKKINLGPGNTSPGGLKYINKATQPGVVEQAFTAVCAPISPAEVFDRFCQAIAQAEGKPCWIEKTPHHVLWLKRIFQAMPGSKVLIMTRSPYAFMLSYKHQGDRKAPANRKLFHRLYHPIGCSLVYRGYVRAIRLSVADYADKVMVTSIEEIQADPDGVFQRIQKYFELTVVQRLADKVGPVNSSFPSGRKPRLGSEDIFWMNLIAGREIRRAGFPWQTERYRFWSVVGSVLTIPVWGFHVAVLFFKKQGLGSIGYLWKWVAAR